MIGGAEGGPAVDRATRWRARLRPWRAELTPEERRARLDELFFEGPELVPFLFRLLTLMAFATVIAALGLIADSPAVVIGAMLVSPLMTPILAFSASLTMGWPVRQLKALAFVAVASAEAIGLAWAVSSIVPAFRPIFLSHELLTRTEPSLLDLAIAIVAGAAGAYVTVHRRSAGALPGVAIAVALIPPLAAVGVLLELGDGHGAMGAFLLFLTNLVSIALASSIVFLASGFVPRGIAMRNSWRIRTGLLTTLLAVAIVAFPLVRESQRVLRKATDERAVSAALAEWLGETPLDVVSVNVDERSREIAVAVEVAGAKPPPPAKTLATLVHERVGRTVSLTVRWTEQRAETASVHG